MVRRLLIPIAASVLLASCSGRNSARVDYCLAALTGLETTGDKLLVTRIGGEGPEVVANYRREGESAEHRLICEFEGSAVSLDQLDLAKVTLDGKELGPGRLTFLKRQWLTREGVTALRQRIVLPPTGYFSTTAVTGVYLQMTLSALPIASVYVLLALGFALIHGITGRINIAHGEFATVGAYAGFMGFMAFGAAAAPLGISAALLFAAIAAGSAGLLTIHSVFLPLARRDGQMLLVASAGLILVYEEGIRLTHASRELWLPPIYSAPIALTLPPYVVTVTAMQLGTAVATALAVAAVFLIMRVSRFGLAWRAVADDALAARFMGVDPARVLATSALIASGLAGGGGLVVLLGYGNANHSMGLMLSVKAMVAALMGGMGSLGGAVAGALILVAIETFWVALFGGAYRDAAVFVVLIGLLTLAPNGLFGLARN
jgi:branched-chain amino acid transport system permease protein